MPNPKKRPQLGCGIYTMADVARYARMPYPTVRSWFKSHGVFDSDYNLEDDRFVVSFYDLVDSMVARIFRNEGVKMPDVRKAYSKLSIELDTPHPFCHRNLFTDGRRIFISVCTGIQRKSLRDAIDRQLLFSHMEELLKRVSYSAITSIAERINIFSGVEINPAVAMGKPVLRGTGLTTHMVASAYAANDCNIYLVTGLYGINGEQVEHAVAFEKQLKNKKAA